jgi:hypothetical protein
LGIWYDVNRDNTERRFKTNESAHFNSKEWSGDLLAAGYKGREGLFLLWDKVISSGFINNRAAAENMIDRLKQGQLRQYHLNYCCFAQDSFLADTNTVGMSYGAFNNSKDMAD